MVTRRDFLKTMAMTSAGLAVGSGEMLRAANVANLSTSQAKAGKVKIAYIGIGNRGEQIINDFERTGMTEVVALCDVCMGQKHTQKVMNMFPKAKRFKDFRELFDKAGNEFDAVAIATPDHSHFPISMLALASGKHVFVEKPMARTFYEAELLIQGALKRPNQVTQVGNQGHSEANYFQFKPAVGTSGIPISQSFLRDNSFRRIWIGIRGCARLLTTIITRSMIRVTGVVGTTSVWVRWVTGERTSSIRYTSSLTWACLMRLR